jgi:hypothetical protein
LTGAAFPEALVQLCIVHMLRQSLNRARRPEGYLYRRGIVPERGAGGAADVDAAEQPREEREIRAGMAGGAEPVSEPVAGTDAEAGKELNREAEGNKERGLF